MRQYFGATAGPHARRLVSALLPLLALALALGVHGLFTGGGPAAALVLAATATAAAGAALVVCAVISARCAPAVPRTRVRTAIRDRERRTAFLPQRDPDARGRARPRAPGRALPTAA
jgi:membrane protein implicated in regulation of membrane protease activity